MWLQITLLEAYISTVAQRIEKLKKILFSTMNFNRVGGVDSTVLRQRTGLKVNIILDYIDTLTASVLYHTFYKHQIYTLVIIM